MIDECFEKRTRTMTFVGSYKEKRLRSSGFTKGERTDEGLNGARWRARDKEAKAFTSETNLSAFLIVSLILETEEQNDT